jgi:hypothetical protein
MARQGKAEEKVRARWLWERPVNPEQAIALVSRTKTLRFHVIGFNRQGANVSEGMWRSQAFKGPMAIGMGGGPAL